MAIYNFETIDDKAFKLVAFGETAILSKAYNFSIQSNTVEVYNVNDRSDILCAFKDFSEYSIDGLTFSSLDDLQIALYELVFNTAIGGSIALLEGRVLSLEDYNNELGSIQFTDTQYTESSRFTILSNVNTQIPNNKGSVFNISAPPIASSWCENDGKLNGDNGNGDYYLARITFTIDPNLNNRNLVFKLDIGGTQGVVWSKTERLARGAGTDTEVSVNIPYYVLNTFFSNGGNLLINCDSEATVYNIVYLITKLKKV